MAINFANCEVVKVGMALLPLPRFDLTLKLQEKTQMLQERLMLT